VSSLVRCFVNNKNFNNEGTVAVTRVTCFITTYQNRINEKSYVPSTCGRATLGDLVFLISLSLHFCCVTTMLASSFLKVVGRIPTSVVYCKCGSQMFWCVDASVKDRYRRRCRGGGSATACRVSTSIRHGTCFSRVRVGLGHVSICFITFLFVWLSYVTLPFVDCTFTLFVTTQPYKHQYHISPSPLHSFKLVRAHTRALVESAFTRMN
jgi:hypothetical protein